MNEAQRLEKMEDRRSDYERAIHMRDALFLLQEEEGLSLDEIHDLIWPAIEENPNALTGIMLDGRHLTINEVDEWEIFETYSAPEPEPATEDFPQFIRVSGQLIELA